MTKKISAAEANRFLARDNEMNWARTIEVTKLNYGYEIVDKVKWWVFAFFYYFSSKLPQQVQSTQSQVTLIDSRLQVLPLWLNLQLFTSQRIC